MVPCRVLLVYTFNMHYQDLIVKIWMHLIDPHDCQNRVQCAAMSHKCSA